MGAALVGTGVLGAPGPEGEGKSGEGTCSVWGGGSAGPAPARAAHWSRER